jgi:hypothetical protein
LTTDSQRTKRWLSVVNGDPETAAAKSSTANPFAVVFKTAVLV